MADLKHIEVLAQGADIWHKWRADNPTVLPDLSGATIWGTLSATEENKLPEKIRIIVDTDEFNTDLISLSQMNLKQTNFNRCYIEDLDLSGADLSEVSFNKAYIVYSKFAKANLEKADFVDSTVMDSDFSGANLSGSCFSHCFFSHNNLSGSMIRNADLQYSSLIAINLTDAILEDCYIYGASVWDLITEDCLQSGLVVSKHIDPEIGRYKNEPLVTVDNIEVAQFIRLIRNNSKIRGIIDTITSKIILILGRFSPERKIVLDALREELRRHDYMPVVFDFSEPTSRDVDETVNLLARMARFIIADLTDAKSLPQELKGIVEPLPSIPVQPILLSSSSEYSMFKHLQAYPWVLDTYRYDNVENLCNSIQEVIAPAEMRAARIASRRAEFEKELGNT